MRIALGILVGVLCACSAQAQDGATRDQKQPWERSYAVTDAAKS